MIYSLREVAPMVGTTYRNIQRWIVRGWITPTYIHKHKTLNRYFFDQKAINKIKQALVGVKRLRHKI